MQAQQRILQRHNVNQDTKFSPQANPFQQSQANYQSPEPNGQQAFFSQPQKQSEPEDPYLQDRLDAYNSSEFVKFTTDIFSRDQNIYNKLSIPLTAICTPFAYPVILFIIKKSMKCHVL